MAAGRLIPRKTYIFQMHCYNIKKNLDETRIEKKQKEEIK